MLNIDLGVIFKWFIKQDPDQEKYGYLPQMATHSYLGCGSLQSSSFSERVNSAANLVLTKGNTLLSDEETNMCAVLHINKPFIDFCRESYLDEINGGNKNGIKGKETKVTIDMNNVPIEDVTGEETKDDDNDFESLLVRYVV